jgi:hypothetical protein
MERNADRNAGAELWEKLGVVTVDDERARFSTWYEMFPRSCRSAPGKHGTFKDCETWLPRIAALGFDVLYFPPIHPVGRVNRKGKNNTLTPGPDDVGSPWAIGAAPRAVIRTSCRNWARWRISAGWCKRPRSTVSRLRWTSPCNARRIIPTSNSIPTGSAGGRWHGAIRREPAQESIRISIPFNFETATGGRCGMRSRASSSSGSSRGAHLSGWIIPIPSRLRCGNG